MTQSRQMYPTDLYAFALLGEPQISPSGNRVAFVRQTGDLKHDSVRSEIWIADSSGGTQRRLTSGLKRDHMPRWSPDGSRLAFVSDRSGKAQIYLIEPDGGEAQAIETKLEPASPPVWSPDGKSIAFVAVEEMAPETPLYPGAPKKSLLPEPEEKPDKDAVKVVTTLHHKQDGMGFFGNKWRHVFVVEAKPTGGSESVMRRVTSGRYNHASPVWSSDGRYIACTANRDLPDSDPVWIRHLWVFDLEGDRAIRVLAEDYPINTPVWSPDGRHLAFVGAPHPFNWVSSPYDLFTVSFDPDASPLSFGLCQNLTRKIDRWVGSSSPSDIRAQSHNTPVWSADGKALYFIVASEGQSHVWRVDREATAMPQQVTPGEQRSIGSFSVSRDGTIAYFAGTATEPDELYILSPDGKERQLTQLNTALAAKFQLSKPERLLFKGADGWDIEGWLLRPVDYEPGKRYATILSVHGGPSGMYGYGFTHQFQMLANHGYAVLYINPRGSSGYSSEFSLAVVGDWGNRDYQDLMAGLDLVIEMGVADPERLGITGWSYGGIMTCFAVTQTDRFKAAISGACISDFFSAYGTSDVGPGFIGFSFGANPWDNPERLAAESSFRHMDRVNTPLLLIHGEDDLRCPVTQSEEVFSVLAKQQKTCVMVRYHGEPHGIAKPRNVVDRLERTLSWFDHYLK